MQCTEIKVKIIKWHYKATWLNIFSSDANKKPAQ